ncbi:hypothetical protein GGD57_004687 [Rhizobium esperanzae]|uniref:Uncharacterized protein n=1 Tax=Rhizobium esperanzae TaxID=1967781 RepID=A0A7W6R750_9HYPH|nr:hypothetical protein [Rhizobium esperanzae]
MRKYKEAERQHPEAQDRQEAQEPAKNEGHADRHPRDARARHADAKGAEHKPATGVIDTEAPCPLPGPITAPRLFAFIAIRHSPEMGTALPNTSSFHFFEKTAWQIGKAFVLAHSHRAKQ